MAQSLVDKGYNINELSVIYIFNKEYNLEITKEQGRPEDVVGFHVVLLYKGNIIDFDFSSTLFVISKETYFKKMFNELESIYLKTIPAAEYVSEYSSKIGILTKDWNYYLKRSDLRYPPRKLTDFLNTP